MPTHCNTKPLEFEPHGHRRVVADFDGGPITSDAGALLLRQVDRHSSLSDQVADCFTDHRDPKRIHYLLRTLIAQRIVARLRGVWPQVKILLRADSGFAGEELMAWCEQNQVDYLFGLARNRRLQDAIAPELAQAQTLSDQQQQPARIFIDLS